MILIDLEQAKEVVRDSCKKIPTMAIVTMQNLEKLPVIEPRARGHWIEIASSNHTYKCSVCGRLLVNIVDGKNNVAKNYPYCHCGADMREDDNEP